MATFGPNNDYFPSFDFKSFLYQIQRGAVPGYIYLQRHAFTHEASSSFFSPIWSVTPARSYPYLTTAQTLTVSSTSVDDTVAGTGARTVRVDGLDANYDLLSETVTLNGQTGVTTVNSFLRINNLTCATFGTDNRNRGDIYIGYGVLSAGKNDTPLHLINAGALVSEVGVFTVPRGFTLVSFDYDGAVSAGKEASIRAYFRTDASSPFQVRGGTSIFEKHTDLFETTTAVFYELADIELQALANSGNTKISVNVQTAIIDNKFV